MIEELKKVIVKTVKNETKTEQNKKIIKVISNTSESKKLTNLSF